MISWKRPRPFPIGLHLGPRTATMVQLTGTGRDWRLAALGCQDIDVDEKASAEEQDRETVAALRKLLAADGFKGRRVVSCLGSGHLFVQNVRLPQLPEEEVEKVVGWEAEERLPYPIGEAEVRHLVAGEVRQNADIKQEVILLACHRGAVNRHIKVLEQAGLRPVGLDAEACALVRALGGNCPPDGQSARCAYVNFGEKATSVIFADGPRILFLKYITGGGHHLDMAVARHLHLETAEAARMRAAAMASSEPEADDEIHQTVIDAIRQTLESIVSEIQLCLRYYKVTFRGKPLEKIVVTGREATPWLQDYLSGQLNTPCTLGNPFELLPRESTGRPVPPSPSSGEPSATHQPGRWTIAMGLSMKGCG